MLYCTIVFKDVNHNMGGTVQLRKMLRVMKVVRHAARKKRVWPVGQSLTNPKGWEYVKTKALWQGIENEFKTKYLKGKPKEKFSTAYNNMRGVKIDGN